MTTDPRNPDFVYDADDEKVWREELDGFLPRRLFDFHGHVYLKEHRPPGAERLDAPAVVEEYPHEVFAAVERTLFPGREIKALVFGSVNVGVELDATNAYVSDAAQAHGWQALMVPSLTDGAETLLRKVRAGGFLGFKPYWTFAAAHHDVAQNDVTLEMMVTDAMREAADRAGLVITTHIPRAGRLADPVNIAGLRRLCADAPNAKIVLAHFGRCYFPEAVGDGLALAEVDNLYPELSFVQDAEVIEAIFRTFDRKKVLFGLDLPVAQEKGKMIGINGQRHFFTKRPHKWSAHVDADSYEVHCTLFAYEIVRAIRKASERAGLSRGEVEDVFAGNAARLAAAVKTRSEGDA